MLRFEVEVDIDNDAGVDVGGMSVRLCVVVGVWGGVGLG